MASFLGRTIQKISSFYRSLPTAASAQAEAGMSEPPAEECSLSTGKRICGTSIGYRPSAADKSSVISTCLPSMPVCAAERIMVAARLWL